MKKVLENMNFWLAKMFSQKDLLEKAAAIKRFEYSLLGKELQAQKFYSLKPQKESTKEKSNCVC